MKVETKRSGENLIIHVSGYVDSYTAFDLRDALADIDLSDIRVCDMDVSCLTHITISGVRELVAFKKRLGDITFTVHGVSDDVAGVFETTGFGDLISYKSSSFDPDYKIMSYKDILVRKAENVPDKTILTYLDRDYTWSDMDKLTQIIAFDLHKLGVAVGKHVGIWGANSANWLLTFFAVQKLGAVAVPLNLGYSASDIVSLSKAGDIEFICLGKMPPDKNADEFAEILTGSDNTGIKTIYDIRDDIDFSTRINEYESIRSENWADIDADDPCVMLFTSGSTGMPKGVMLSAFGIVRSVDDMMNNIRMTSNDKVCLIMPFFHIFGIQTGISGSILRDAQIIIPENMRTDTILDTIERYKCTICHSVPTMIYALINNKNFSPERVKTLRSAVLAGAPMSETRMSVFNSYFPTVHFGNAYGLSEMAPVSMTEYGDSMYHLTQTIGRVIPRLEVRIHDSERDVDCALGEVGEILARGYNAMSCYYKVPLEDQSIDEEGWLHTGDLGRLDGNGYLYFSGRIKELIIRGGENIIPYEIESIMAGYEEVRDVKIVGASDDFWGEIVVAAVTIKAGFTFDEEDMRAKLIKVLPKYKVPAYIFPYDELPKLPTGKVDVTRLRDDVARRIKSV